MLPVPGHVDFEPAVHGGFVARADGDGHVDKAPVDALQGDFAGHHHILIGDLDAAVVFNFPDRHLAQSAVSDGQLSGNGHLTHKTLVRQMAAAGFPVLHPADHHPAAIVGFQSLHGVEIHAVVNGLHIVPEQMILLLIQLTDDAHIGVAGVELQTHRVHLLGTGHQDILAVQLEKVRALPHLAVLVVAGG